MILANDDRQVSMHAEAERTDRDLPPEAVANLLDRNDSRRAARSEMWRQHAATERAHQAAYERFTAAAERDAERSRGLDIDGLEL